MGVSDLDDIAIRLAEVVVSPDTVTSMINGALTVPLDLGYLVLGYFNTDSRFAHQTQRIRMAEAIRNDIMNYDHIVNAVNIILREFDKHLSRNQQNKAYRTVVSSIVGRMLATHIASKIAGAVLARTSFISARSSSKVINLVSMFLLVGGMSERSIRTSETLAIEAPEIYEQLRPHDYDLTYFLFEPAVAPFVEAIHVGVTQGQPAFDKIIARAEEELNATH
ncbi:hypothetical protein QMZ30_07175 [Pantoea sp. EA-12]|uniref:hypothetical protein n=1 Tax=Pantoea sp. EA-12 TaxID=3043303 RepID=UPI0024B5E386|nr:hypothetical protein [Pantoea sp. EA-12]MDI9220680.1 hypothetical protein [Pantoea sp. EA-12]